MQMPITRLQLARQRARWAEDVAWQSSVMLDFWSQPAPIWVRPAPTLPQRIYRFGGFWGASRDTELAIAAARALVSRGALPVEAFEAMCREILNRMNSNSNRNANNRMNSNSNRNANSNSRGWEQPPQPNFYNTRNTRDTGIKDLMLVNVPWGVAMPVEGRGDEISRDTVPFQDQVYLQDNLNNQGKPRRVYALPTLQGLLNQKNPFTRRRFTRSNIKRVAR